MDRDAAVTHDVLQAWLMAARKRATRRNAGEGVKQDPAGQGAEIFSVKSVDSLRFPNTVRELLPFADQGVQQAFSLYKYP
jgi:hypothetical protein